MSRDFDDGPDPDDAPRFPGGAIAAGIIWIAFGGLGLLGIGMNLLSFAVLQPQNAPPAGPPLAAMACVFGCFGLIAGAFLYAGIQTVRGAARDTLGNAVGSIVLAVPAYGFAAMGVFMGAVGVGGPAGGGAPPPNFMIAAGVMVAVVYGLAGTTLLAAGVMALYARQSYLAWRAANGLGPRRRAEPDDLDDTADR